MRRRKFKNRFRYNPKRYFLFWFLFVGLVSLSVGYAMLTQTLEIDGVSKIQGSTWDIHFANIQVDANSVMPTAAATITNPTTVTFDVSLGEAGDFYDFTVDVVNSGTYNAMIDSFTLLPVLTAEQQQYLEYTVTYLNGVELAPKQKLDAGTQETLKVHFGYLTCEGDTCPTEDLDLEVSVEIQYIQADGTEEEIGSLSVTCEEGTYLPANSSECVPCEVGNYCPGGDYDVALVDIQGKSPCPAGSYQDETGKSVCKVCANGKTSSAGATASCTANCSNNANVGAWVTPTWNVNKVDNSCTASTCVAGTYKNGTSCSACGKGTYKTGTNNATSCTSCPAGSYQDETGKSVCKVCANGKTSSAGATASCTANCSNNANVSTWVTPSWNTNAVSNSCVPSTCASGYAVSDGACRKIITVTFNYNKASWNTNTTRTCTLKANGTCTVTAPGISNITGTNKNSQNYSNFFSIKGWNTNSSATTATYGATATITVSANTTYYAIVTLAKTSFWIYADALKIRTTAGTGTATGQLQGNVISPTRNAGYYVTVNNFVYLSGNSSNPIWLNISSYDSYYSCVYGSGVSCPSSGCVCTGWGSAYYLIYP